MNQFHRKSHEYKAIKRYWKLIQQDSRKLSDKRFYRPTFRMHLTNKEILDKILSYSEDLSDEALVMLSDILPTGYEIGVLKGKVEPGCSVAIIGSGPVGLAALLTAQFYSPAKLIMVDLDDNRLDTAVSFGATHKVNSSDPEKAIKEIYDLTDGRGVDVAIEAVGIPETFDFCQKIIGVDGTVANCGVHGKPVEFDLDKLWIRNINVTTGLVSTNTTPQLLKALESHKIEPEKLVTHYFKLSEIEKAYEVFSKAADHHAIKVIIENDISEA
ncbi:alcohol dehydrogenase [Streptococcus pneumoniae]|nr:alcohol dehydrogenase [Streptococcus pneumoniae]